MMLMVIDWQSESGLDSIHNSCDVFSKKMHPLALNAAAICFDNLAALQCNAETLAADISPQKYMSNIRVEY